MIKNEVLNYIDELMLKEEQRKKNFINNNYKDLFSVRDNAKSVVVDENNLAYTNFEQLDEFIAVPYDALNVLTLYQGIILSKSYVLLDEQKQYIKYMFQEFVKILERVFLEILNNSDDIYVINEGIFTLEKIKNVFNNSTYFDIDEYVFVVRLVEKCRGIDEEDKKVLLTHLSNYFHNSIDGKGLKGK